MKKNLFTAVMAIAFVFAAKSQNLDNENIDVKYLRYPTNPLSEDVKTYSKDIHLSTLDSDQSRSSIESQMKSATDLPGYELVDTDGHLKIRLYVGSFSTADTKLQSENKEKKDKDGKVTKWTEYYYTYSYKYPTKLTITNTLTDEVLFDDYLNSSQDYAATSSDRSKDSKTAGSLREKSVTATKSKVLSDNFSAASNIIKRRYGYTPTTDRVSLKRVKKFKKFEYPRIDQGVDIAKEALGALEPVEGYATEEFKGKIMEAVKLFDEELTEYDPYYKKARVNEKVASAVYNNLALCYYWINDFDKASEALASADGLKGDGWTNTVSSEVEAKKSRYEANGLIK